MSNEASSISRVVLQSHLKTIVDLYLLNGDEAIAAASHMLAQARKIVLFSVGMSNSIAYALCGTLRQLGLNASCQPDFHLQTIAAAYLQQGDLALGIS